MTGESGGIGVYFLNGEISNPPPNGLFSDVIAYAEKLPGVKSVKQMDGAPGSPQQLAQEIKAGGLQRLILAGLAPGFFKSAFTRAMTLAGYDPGNVTVADLAQYGDDIEPDRAKAVLAGVYYGVPFQRALMSEEAEVHPDTLVIGGGIAGIQASLEIADAGQKVFLVEKTGTIGGHMAMFDKTFPTLDCAACILTPKMVEVGQHHNIELMAYCEVQSVSGDPGNYKVKILKKARRVDLNTCIGCGVCTEKCPGTAPSEFDSNTTMRKAIYMPFPQAVPNKYLIDAENCVYCKTGKCGLCAKVCPGKAVRLDDTDETVEITVGNIIVATGFRTFDAKRGERWGYGRFPNVLTSLELERLINAGGPTGGHIYGRDKDKKGNPVFLTEGVEPKSIALIHCIGSRDENYNTYCSKVCCMYSLKLAHLVKEKIPDACVNEYYIDMRAFGKGYEEFYERIKSEGVDVIRGRTAQVEPGENGKLKLRTESLTENKLILQEVDMVVLAVGLEPRGDAAETAEMLGIPQDKSGWYREADYNTGAVDTFNGGIYIAGLCQGPKDIPDTVAQASAAASRVLQNISRGKVQKSPGTFSLEHFENHLKQIAAAQ